jgi:hypothetical protein
VEINLQQARILLQEKNGWWVTAIGPDKAVDTNKYFVICANVLGDAAWEHRDQHPLILKLKNLL